MKNKGVFIIGALLVAISLSACNGGTEQQSSAVSDSITTESSTENSEESVTEKTVSTDITEKVKEQDSYKLLYNLAPGKTMSITSGDTTSLYGLTEDYEFFMIDSGKENDTEFKYVRYTEGNQIFIVDTLEKYYVQQVMPDDNGGELSVEQATEYKKNFFHEVVDYMYAGIEFKEKKDGVEYYRINYEDTDVSDDSTDNTRQITVDDDTIKIVDTVNGNNTNSISIVIADLTEEDKKNLNHDGCELYEVPESEVSDDITNSEPAVESTKDSINEGE